MKKKRNLLFIAAVLAIYSCKNENKITTEVKILADYPSASGIAYYNDKIYIIGDDANTLRVLDSKFNSIDSFVLYSFAEKRIPKPIKADLEAITVLPNGKLLLTGSGSVAPYRNIAWLIDPVTKQKDSIRLDTFYQRLLLHGIKEINLEGGTAIPGAILFSNRGSKGYRQNHLIFTEDEFWNNQEKATIHIIPFAINNDSSIFNGISGLAYAAKSDQLLLTVSTEDIRNSYDDGAIGKSYLWIVKNINSKKDWKAITPDKIIDLEQIDPRFKQQKIESVCITKETSKMLYLLLAADNDDGSSTLFKIVISKD